MLILLDQDGVLANFEQGFITNWHQRFGEEPPIAGQDHLFYVRDRLPEHLRHHAAEIFGAEGFFEQLPPIDGALHAAQALLEAGHDVRICTAPVNEYRYCVGEKIAWVEKHLGADWAKRVILTKDKTLVRGDILIDDKSHITGCLKPMWTHRIYDAPHNRHINAPQRIVWAQAETWSDLLPAL